MNREEYIKEEKRLLNAGYNIYEVDAIMSDDVRKTALANAYKTGDLRLYASLCSMYNNANKLENANTEVYNDEEGLSL